MKCLLRALAVCLPLIASSPAAQATWTPDFQLIPGSCPVSVGSPFTVDVFVSGVAGNTAGYQVEILFDPTQVMPVSIVQGGYLPFGTFLAFPGAFPDKVRIGALDLLAATMMGPGPGMGVLATVTFMPLTPGPAHLDLTDFCLFSAPGGAYSIPGTTNDYVVQLSAPSDRLVLCGVPNLGSTLTLRLQSPADAGAFAITAGALSSTGIPVPGVGIIPLAFDPLLDLALLDVYPFSGSVGTLDSAGTMFTGFTIPPVPALVGQRFFFASVISGSGGLVLSNGTWLDVLDA